MSYIDLRHSGSHLGDRVSVTAIKLGKGSANASKLQKIFNTPASRIPIPKTPMSFVTPTRIGEVRQFCQLQPEGQSLMRAAIVKSFGTSLSPHPQAIPHHRRLGWERRYPITAFGRGVAISSENYDGMSDDIPQSNFQRYKQSIFK